MKIDAVSTLDVVVYAGEVLADAASRMRFNDVGCVPVIDAGKLVGILTERDLTRAIADGIDPKSVEVVEYMTPDPVVIGPDADARDAARTMIQAGVRHLPIVWGSRYIGVISIRDVVGDLLHAIGSGATGSEEPAA
jgi:CBS domain-containing protein